MPCMDKLSTFLHVVFFNVSANNFSIRLGNTSFLCKLVSDLLKKCLKNGQIYRYRRDDNKETVILCKFMAENGDLSSF